MRCAELQVYDTSIASDRRLHPGVIEECSPAGWLIGAHPGAVRVRDTKVAAQDFAAAQGITPGTLLGATER